MKVLISIYGYKNDLNNALKITELFKNDNIDYRVLSIKNEGLKEKNLFYLLEYKEYKEKYQELFYYFFSDRFIYEMSGLEGYVSTDFPLELIWKSFFRVVSFLDKHLEEFNPDVVFLYNGPDNYFSNLLAKLCEKRGINYFWLNHEYFSDKFIYFSNALTYTNKFFLTYKENEYGKFNKTYFLQKDIISSNYDMFYRYTFKGYIKLIKKNFKYLKNSYKIYDIKEEDRIFLPWLNEPNLNLKNKIIKIKNLLINKFNSMFFTSLDKLIKSKKDKKYLLFPLHEQPEAVTLSSQPLFNEQYYFIKLIADILPPNWILLVKEYPIYTQNIGIRPIWFYKRIKKLKNVRFLKFDININQLQENNLIDKLITIGGSTGFEFMLNGNPPLVFSDIYYSNFKYISKVNCLEFNSLREKLWNFLNSNIDDIENYEKELERFLGAYKNSLVFNDKNKSAYQIIKNLNYYF